MAEIKICPVVGSIESRTIHDESGELIIEYAMNIPNPLYSQGYFYSTYNPTEHFTYNIHFKDDGITPDNIDNGVLVVDDNRVTNKNIAKAYAKVVEYHFSFEQVLPKEAEEYIELYIPKYVNNEPQDYLFDVDIGTQEESNIITTGSRYKFFNITQKQFEGLIAIGENKKIEKLPTKSAYIKDVASCRDMDDKSYSDMNVKELNDLYNLWVSQTEQQGAPWKDATMINQHLYNCSLYCRIYRPEKLNTNGQKIPVVNEQGQVVHDKDGNILYEHVAPYEFRRVLRLVNQVFNFKLPIEEGWYTYNKQTHKWEFIEFKAEEAEEVNS